MSQADLEEGRRAYAGRRWDVCVEALRAADADDALSGEDLKLLGLSPYMTGEDEASAEMLERTHRWAFDHERWPEAAETAFWYAFILFNSGEPARGGAWLARSRSIVEDLDVEGSTAAEQLAHAGAGEPSSLKSMLRGGRVRALAGEASAILPAVRSITSSLPGGFVQSGQLVPDSGASGWTANMPGGAPITSSLLGVVSNLTIVSRTQGPSDGPRTGVTWGVPDRSCRARA